MSGDQEGQGKGFTVVDRRQSRDDSAPATQPDPAPAAVAAAGEHADHHDGDEPLEEIDFSTFVLSLASSALMYLGELAPEGQEPHVSVPLAKQTIDLLGMLESKTRGNLTADEARLLEHLLYDLRLKFVSVRGK